MLMRSFPYWRLPGDRDREAGEHVNISRFPMGTIPLPPASRPAPGAAA
ncbi:hypothetical protein SAMN02982929_01724 [Saccharopolyspora kobensis]|uniref:Uncharacterized protein n=1 Tax=Saccharopolyspora kobensis TaxID=146035 RepID=A0A1H5Y227_9PSEU|nr:hypothetical protein SAMN02982929_01724 [Saccharopolyspora kobensis]SFF09319.1 hypothetical protein SAMN05216506_11918 [Saccharopolyspora kobensis]